MEDEIRDIGADETTLLDGSAMPDETTLLDAATDDATTLLDDAATDDATTLLDDAATDDATTLLDDAASDETTLLEGAATDAIETDDIAPDETGLFTETDLLEDDLPEEEPADEDQPNDEFPDESDEEYDRRMMITAVVGALVFVLALFAGIALSGVGGRLFHLFFMPAPIDEAPATLLAPQSPTQPTTSNKPSSTSSAPVNAGANAADVTDARPRNGTPETPQFEDPLEEEELEEGLEEELEPEPEPEPEPTPAPTPTPEPSQPAEEEKTWVDEQGHFEDVYETQLVEVGQNWVVDVPSEPIVEVVDGVEVVTGYTEEQGHFEPIYEEQQVVVGQEWVIDVPGHWE